GNVIIAGTFPSNSPLFRLMIARVNPAGALDPTFDAGYIGGSAIQAVALQPDGKVIVGGQFTSINGYSRLGIARLNTNGTVDTSFVLPVGFSGLSALGINLLPNGKVLLFGAFSLNQNYGIVQLNS